MKGCPYCQAALPDSAQFCANCGKAIPVYATAAEPQNVNPADAPQTPPVYPNPGIYPPPPTEEPIGLGKWVLYQLIPYIPFVGSLVYLVMLFIWGFGSDKNETFRNWAKSQLILTAIGLVLAILVIVILVVFATAGATAISTVFEDGAYYGY